MYPIEDVANSICHQRLNKIFIFLPVTTSTKSANLLTRKLLSCHTPTKLDAILCNQHAFVIIERADFIQHMPDKSFLINDVADFLDVLGKKLDFAQSLVAFGISNMCY